MPSVPEVGLINGNVYTVIGSEDCQCGQNIYVGIDLPKGELMTICAPGCGQIINLDDRYFFSHEAFRALQEIEELVESENQKATGSKT